MAYTIYRGVDNHMNQAALKSGATALSVAAVVLLAAAFFSYTHDRAAGSSPYISAPKHLNLSVQSPPTKTNSPSNTANTPSSSSINNSSSSSTPSVAQFSPSAAPDSTLPPAITPPLSGGMGGGPLPAGDPTSSATSNPNPVQTTLSIPPIDLQAGDKQIISTSGTSVTLN